MTAEWIFFTGGFIAPMDIGTNPGQLLWMFPLLAAIAIVYKATKVRVVFPARFFREVLVLFLTISIFMVLTGIGLCVAVQILTR